MEKITHPLWTDGVSLDGSGDCIFWKDAGVFGLENMLLFGLDVGSIARISDGI